MTYAILVKTFHSSLYRESAAEAVNTFIINYRPRACVVVLFSAEHLGLASNQPGKVNHTSIGSGSGSRSLARERRGAVLSTVPVPGCAVGLAGGGLALSWGFMIGKAQPGGKTTQH